MEFMDEASLCATEQTCWDARHTLVTFGQTVWRRALSAEIERSMVTREAFSDGVVGPLRDGWEAKALLLALRCVRKRAEAERLAGVRQLCEAASRERAEGGKILAVLSDIAWTEDAAVGYAISARRPGAAATVVVHSTADMLQFRKRQRERVEGPVSFLPMSADMLGAWTDPATGAHAIAELPAVSLPGFVGRAVHLVQLREQHEFLRPTVLYTMLRDLAVFDTEEHAQAYRDAEAAAGRTAWAISVDFPLPARPAPRRPGDAGRARARGSARQLCLSLLHLLQLEDLSGPSSVPAVAGAGDGEGAGEVAVAQRLVATTRTRAGRTRERQYFACHSPPVRLADMSAHEQWEAVRCARRDYNTHLRALESVLLGRGAWPETEQRHFAMERARVKLLEPRSRPAPPAVANC